MAEHSKNSGDALPPITSFNVLAYRVFWCFGGPVILAFLLYKIAFANDGWLTPSDLAYPIVLIATVAARWASFRAGDRSNSVGEVTTIDQLRRYSIVFTTVGLLIWIVANVLGNRGVN